jgi:hypothetical protein
MSSPVGRDERPDDPLLYVPRWAREMQPQPSTIADAPPMAPALASASPAPPRANPPESPRVNPPPRRAAAPAAAPIDAPPTAPMDASLDAASMAAVEAPRMAPGIGGPNLGLPPARQRRFAGDVAIKDLQRRLSLDPDLVLRAPLPARRASAVPWIGRFALVLGLAAIGAFAITLATVPSEVRTNGIAATVAPLLEDLSQANAAPVRLVVESQKGFTNDPLPLGVALNEATGSETLTLVGLANGTRLTAGAPLGLTGWQLAARDLGKAFAYAPKDFVGVMDAAVDLRSPRDRLMDSQIVRLEWVQKKEVRLTPKLEPTKLDQSRVEPNAPDKARLEPTKSDQARSVVQQPSPEEIATLVKRAEDFLKIGDISAARLALRRAANSGHASAALVLGMTFDPQFLAEQGVIGFAPEPTQARAWYERAVELGSTEAARRLERLAITARP